MPLKPPFLTTHCGLYGCSSKHTLTCGISPPQMLWETPRAFRTQTTCISIWGTSPESQRPVVSQHLFCKAAPPYHILAHDPTSHLLSFKCTLYLKYRAKTIRQVCRQTTGWREVGVGWEASLFLSIWEDYTRKLSFIKAIENSHFFVKATYSWGMLILMNFAITKQKLKEVLIRLKIQVLIWKEKYYWCSRKSSAQQEILLTFVVMHYRIFWQKRKRLHNLPGRENMTRTQ